MEDLRELKIGVLGGGVSAEREISFASARAVVAALRRNRLPVVFLDIFTAQREKIKEVILAQDIDVVFIALHGEFGEDGRVQQIMEELNIPYTGSGPHASYLAMDKVATKKVFRQYDIPTPSFCVWQRGQSLPGDVKYPLVVKPFFSGSSLGVSIVKDKRELAGALGRASSLAGGKVILEEYIEGREFTVGILEDQPLPVLEIIPAQGYFDFTTKYTHGCARFEVPASLPREVYQRVQALAYSAHRALGCRHFSRVDLRLDRGNRPFFLEVNAIPGLTSHSLLPRAAAAGGVSFDELILKIVRLSLNAKTSA